MKFSIDRSKLQKCLGIVAQAVPKTSVNPILKSILVEVKDGRITFRATNGEVEITSWTEGSIEAEGACCVDSIMVDIIDGFVDGEINFNKLKTLTVSQGKRRHSLSFKDSDNFPSKVKCSTYEKFPTADIVRAFDMCSIAVHNGSSKEQKAPIYQTYGVVPSEDYVIAGDGHQLALYQNIKLPGMLATPLGRRIDPLLSFLASAEEVEVSFGSWTGFKGTDWEIMVNSFSGEYPDIKRLIVGILEKEPALTLKIDKDDLQRALKICKLYSIRADNEGKHHHTVLRKSGPEVTLSMQIQDLSDMVEPLECEAVGENEFSIWFLPGDLEEVVLKLDRELTLKFYGQKSPFLVTDPKYPDYYYIQSPMAIQDGKETPKEEVKEEVAVPKIVIEEEPAAEENDF